MGKRGVKVLGELLSKLIRKVNPNTQVNLEQDTSIGLANQTLNSLPFSSWVLVEPLSHVELSHFFWTRFRQSSHPNQTLAVLNDSNTKNQFKDPSNLKVNRTSRDSIQVIPSEPVPISPFCPIVKWCFNHYASLSSSKSMKQKCFISPDQICS